MPGHTPQTVPHLVPPGMLGPVTSRVFGYWADLARSLDRLPSRRDVDPFALAKHAPEAIPHLWLLDVERDPWRFRLRLIGGALKSAGSPGRPGDYLDGVDRSGEVARCLQEVCVSLRPDVRRGRPVLPHHDDIEELEVLYLPLAADGNTADGVLCCTDYRWREGCRPAYPRYW